MQSVFAWASSCSDARAIARELTQPAPRRRFAPLFPLPHHLVAMVCSLGAVNCHQAASRFIIARWSVPVDIFGLKRRCNCHEHTRERKANRFTRFIQIQSLATNPTCCKRKHDAYTPPAALSSSACCSTSARIAPCKQFSFSKFNVSATPLRYISANCFVCEPHRGSSRRTRLRCMKSLMIALSGRAAACECLRRYEKRKRRPEERGVVCSVVCVLRSW
jgi:hypothetical protein